MNIVHLREFTGNSHTSSTILINSWILDTGATSHLCCDQSLFESLVFLESPVSLFLPDGSSKLVHLTGDIVTNSNLVLHLVLYCPHFKHNLISIQKLIAQNNDKAIFTGDKC